MINKKLLEIVLIIIVIIMAVILALLPINLPSNIIYILYVSVSILFAVLLSATTTINLEGVTDERFINIIRDRIYCWQKRFAIYFAITTFIVVINEFDFRNNIYGNLFDICVLIYIAILFAVNFVKLQQLKDNIFDRIHRINDKS